MEEEAGAGSLADRLLDEVLPEELQWRRLVHSYPLAAVAVAAGLGYFLGRRHGAAVLTSLSGYAMAQVTDRLGPLLGDD